MEVDRKTEILKACLSRLKCCGMSEFEGVEYIESIEDAKKIRHLVCHGVILVSVTEGQLYRIPDIENRLEKAGWKPHTKFRNRRTSNQINLWISEALGTPKNCYLCSRGR